MAKKPSVAVIQGVQAPTSYPLTALDKARQAYEQAYESLGEFLGIPEGEGLRLDMPVDDLATVLITMGIDLPECTGLNSWQHEQLAFATLYGEVSPWHPFFDSPHTPKETRAHYKSQGITLVSKASLKADAKAKDRAEQEASKAEQEASKAEQEASKAKGKAREKALELAKVAREVADKAKGKAQALAAKLAGISQALAKGEPIARPTVDLAQALAESLKKPESKAEPSKVKAEPSKAELAKLIKAQAKDQARSKPSKAA